MHQNISRKILLHQNHKSISYMHEMLNFGCIKIYHKNHRSISLKACPGPLIYMYILYYISITNKGTQTHCHTINLYIAYSVMWNRSYTYTPAHTSTPRLVARQPPYHTSPRTHPYHTLHTTSFTVILC